MKREEKRKISWYTEDKSVYFDKIYQEVALNQHFSENILEPHTPYENQPITVTTLAAAFES